MKTRLYLCLLPGAIHEAKDEMWDGYTWIPLPAVHVGTRMDPDSAPCRRPYRMDRLYLEIGKILSQPATPAA